MRAWICLVSLLRVVSAQDGAAQDGAVLPPGAAQALHLAASPYASWNGAKLPLGPDGRVAEESARLLFEGIASPAVDVAADSALALLQLAWDRKPVAGWLRLHAEAPDAAPFNPMLSPASVARDPRLARLETRADLDQALVSADDELRARVAPFAGAIGSGSPSTIAALVSCLSSPSPALRWRAAWAIQLSAGTAAAREAVPALRELLTDRDELVRAFGAAALARCAPRDEKLLPAVISLCAARDATTARVAVETLRLGAVESGQAVEPLLVALRRHGLPEAARALGACGAAARPAVPLLIAQALRESGPRGGAATNALRELRIGDEAWVRALCEHCDSASPMIRREAAQRLGQLGPRAKAAIPKLLESLEDDDHHVRIAAISALAAIGPDAAVALPRIERIFGEDDAWSRVQRLAIAGSVAGFGEKAIRLLELASQDGDARVVESATAGLARLRR